MIERRHDLTLILQGPILSQASGAMRFGLDMAMQRYRGQPVLNGSQIRGNIRHVLRKFDARLGASDKPGLSEHLKRWFPDEDKKNFTDQRSPLVFDMFWISLARHPKSGIRTRIAIESGTGKVQKGALAIAEDLYPSGSCVPFHGVIHGRFKDDSEADAFAGWLDKALQWLAAIGAQKGVGYGRLLWHELQVGLQVAAAAPAPPSATTGRLRLRLALDRPFCIGRQVSREHNRIVSSTGIPGHIIKGVLARRLGEQSQKTGAELSNELQTKLDFDRLVVNHARPLPCGEEALAPVIPLNLARVKDEWRSFTSPEPPADLPEAPAFQPDWKREDWQAAARHLGINAAEPERHLLVRTAIDERTGAAKESQLFSLECMEPAGFTWVADIDLAGVEKNRRDEVIKELQSLLAPGLDSIGKTRARAQVRMAAVAPPALEDSEVSRWQITLQTPARMLPLGFCPPGINGYEAMCKAYAKYWRTQSAGSLEMTAHFARQRLAGGEYYYHHFRTENNYTTELLTEPGSVFILQAAQGKEDDARAWLQTWLRCNLPAWQNQAEPANWETTVHIPEHGYGEIRVQALEEEEA